MQSPYLKSNRLSDLLAAIQSMALHDRYRVSAAEWAELISGNRDRHAYWRSVFEDHPEFFRQSVLYPGEYALVWRRALSKRWDVRLQSAITDEDYRHLLKADRQRYISRAPVPESHIKTLMDTAIGLHQKAIDASRDWRWWVAPVLTGGSAFLGAIFGAVLRHQ